MNDPDSGAFERAKRTPPTIDLDPSEVTVTGDAPETAATGSQDSKPDAVSEKTDRERASRERKASADANRPWTDNASNALIPALSGATAAALILTGAWLLGLSGDNRPSANAPMPVSADGPATADLTARLAKVEADLATKLNTPLPSGNATDPALTKRADQADASIKSITAAVASLRADLDRTSASVKDVAAAPRDSQIAAFDPAPIEQRMSQIETTQRALTQAMQQAAKPFDDAPLRRVLAASALASAVREGEPYADLLSAAKNAAPLASLQPLEQFAATGAPNDATLTRELIALLPRLEPAAPKQAATTGGAGGVLDRLQESAARLVKVERVEQSNTETSASTAKVASAARNGDVAAAKIALMDLPAAQRAPAQAWLDRIQARDAIRDVARQFAAAQIAALPKPMAPNPALPDSASPNPALPSAAR